jgi:superfamily II DNA or RNA helicase
MSYADFLASKAARAGQIGRDCEPGECHPMLHDWQAEAVAWAVTTGRAAIFWDCGLGKTFAQVEWARLSAETALIFAPLSVARQTVREARKIDVDVRYARTGADVTGPGVWITNYEMAHHFEMRDFGALVLDESSILKNVDGKTRKFLTAHARDVPLRLACTATPAPNDVAELVNHAEFLGLMRREEMLAAYFVNDEKEWRLKGHARGPMFRWMASWAHAMTRPSDLGYPDEGYALPPLTVESDVVEAEIAPGDGQLFATDLGGVGGRAQVRRQTMGPRIARAAELAAGDEQCIVWCGLNDEAAAVTAAIDGAVNVEGSWTPDDKARALEAFQDGEIRVLVTKSSIAGFGMNFQNCRRMVFLGLGDSYEQYYQAIRRCWRFGQQHPVTAHVVVSRLETAIVQNVRRKEREAGRWHRELVAAMNTRQEVAA